MIRKGVEELGDIFSGDADEEDVKAIEVGAKDATKKTEGLIAPEIKKSPPEEIEAFRREFGEVLSGLGKTLVVLIDNIDRCTPPNTIHTLEAIRLFLFLPRTAFVIAADEDMVRHAVATHFNNPSQRLVEDLPSTNLSKCRSGCQNSASRRFGLIMLLLFAEAAGVDAGRLEDLRAFPDRPVAAGMEAGRQVRRNRSTRDFEAPGPRGARHNSRACGPNGTASGFYSAKVNGNPRIIKRMLNVVRMRASVARKRKMELDESVIAKLALFERCN